MFKKLQVRFGSLLVRVGTWIIKKADDPITEIADQTPFGDHLAPEEEEKAPAGWGKFEIPLAERGRAVEVQVSVGRGRMPMTVPKEIQYRDGSKTTIAVKDTTDRDLFFQNRTDEHCFSHGYPAAAHE